LFSPSERSAPSWVPIPSNSRSTVFALASQSGRAGENVSAKM